MTCEIASLPPTLRSGLRLTAMTFFGLFTSPSRLYYYIFYHVRALLLSKGLEPKTHEGSLRLLSLHFVKEGILSNKMSHIFSKLMKFREEADYNPSYVFTK